ncbi:MAG: hypothetical protein GEU28_04705 [Dehalococcoidia bacterium]|nr:hypothetical protein [Dehalococcoidia bacterium]
MRTASALAGPLIIAVVAVLFVTGLLGQVMDYYHEFTAAVLRFAEWLLEEYGYVAVFVLPLLENTLFLGLFVPGALVILFAGLAIQQGILEWYYALPLAIGGSMIGDTLSYLLGRYGWVRLLGEKRADEIKERWRDKFIDNAPVVILLYHFLGYTRLVGPTAAGVLHIPFRRWAPLDYAGVTLWVLAFATVGFILGVIGFAIDDSEDNVRLFEYGIIAMVVVYIALKGWRNSRAQPAE